MKPEIMDDIENILGFVRSAPGREWATNDEKKSADRVEAYLATYKESEKEYAG